MQTYIATVKILVAAPSQTDACDVIAAALNDPINTAFVDWVLHSNRGRQRFRLPRTGPRH